MTVLATPVSQQGYITVSGSTFSLVEGSYDGSSWAPLYAGAAVSTRNVYPGIDIPVYLRADGVHATPYPVTLPPQGSPPLNRIWLVSVDDPTLKVPLGPYGSADSANNWTTVRDSIELVAAGQTHSDWAFSPHIQFVAGNEAWLFIAYNLEDGTRQKPKPLCDRLVRMELEAHRLLWRDNNGVSRYCRIFNTDPRQVNAVMWQCSFSLKTILPPSQPLST